MARRISVRIDGHLAERLDATVAERGMTRSELVNEALQRYLEEARPAATFMEAARDLVGSLDGPADLSTNRGRLRHFGGRPTKPGLVDFLRSSPLMGARLAIGDRSKPQVSGRRRPKHR